MNKYWSLSFALLCCGCHISTETEKYQSSRNNTINVRDQVVEIVIDTPFISTNSRLYLMDDYLIVKDFKALDEHIYLFDRNSYTYVTGIARKGQGPGEIANIGYLAVDEANRRFYVPDLGKFKLFSYELDSVLNHSPSYLPDVKLELSENIHPMRWQLLNDSIAFCSFMEPIGTNNFKPTPGKMNMQTGGITLMPYEHPERPNIKGRKRSSAVSCPEHGIYVESYQYNDLLTIGKLDGDLVCNIYGPDWGKNRRGFYYYGNVIFCGDRIYTTYLGEHVLTEKGESNIPTKFHVFDLSGNYIQTLDIGLHIVGCCYDKQNNRILMCFDDEIQFGYLPLDLII